MIARRLISAACAVAALSLSQPAWSQSAYKADLVLAITNMVNTFDPHMTASVGTDLSVLGQVYPALVTRLPDMSIAPSLATSWENVDDNTWRFTLREGATFADGEPINAETVKWNIERVLNPDTKARIRSWFTPVDKVTVISPTEVEIHTSSPYPSLVGQLSMFFLLPQKWAETHDPAKELSSGGAYEITNVVPGDSISLKANSNYWGEKPKFDTVIYRVIPDAAARIAAVQTGEVDYINNIPTGEIDNLNTTGTVAAGAIPSTRTAFIKFNTTIPPLDNQKFRQALNYAIDKELIADAIFDGKAQVAACQITPATYFGHNPDLKPYPYDVEKAKELLKEAGGAPAQPIELQVPTDTYLNGNEVVEEVAAELAEIGVQTNIVEMQFSTYMDRYLREKSLGAMSLLTHAWPSLDADGILSLWAPGSAYAYWDNQEFGDLLKEGRATLDPEKRVESYKKATQLMCDQAPLIFLYVQPTTYATSKRVTWAARGDDWVRPADMTPVN